MKSMTAIRTFGVLGLWLLGAAFVASSLVGCGEEESGTPQRVSVQAYVPAGLPTGSWQSVNILVRLGDGAAQALCSVYVSGQSVGLPEIPFDEQFTVELQFYTEANCSGAISARGESLPTVVDSGSATAMQVYVPVTPINAFVATTSATTATVTNPQSPRYGASVTELPDGRIVVIGGARLIYGSEQQAAGGLFDNPGEDDRPWDILDNIEQIYDTVEIYDPATGTWEYLETDVASSQTLFFPRAFHQAVYLPNGADSGLIAVIGGYQQLAVGESITASASVEYFQVSGKFFLSATSPDIQPNAMQRARVGHTADVLTYGATDFVLVVGGEGDDAASTYEVLRTPPSTEAAIPVQSLPNPRTNHRTAMVTTSAERRQLFVIGGDAEGQTSALVDLYEVDVVGDASPAFLELPGFDAPAGLSAGGRVGHQVVYVDPDTSGWGEASGVYVIGGFSDFERTQVVDRIEVLDPTTGAPNPGADASFTLDLGRGLHSAVWLSSGHILVSGGLEYTGEKLRSVVQNEVIGRVNDGSGEIIRSLQIGPMLTNRFMHNSVGLANGQGFVTGGLIKTDDFVRMVGDVPTDQGSEVIAF